MAIRQASTREVMPRAMNTESEITITTESGDVYGATLSIDWVGSDGVVLFCTPDDAAPARIVTLLDALEGEAATDYELDALFPRAWDVTGFPNVGQHLEDDRC